LKLPDGTFAVNTMVISPSTTGKDFLGKLEAKVVLLHSTAGCVTSLTVVLLAGQGSTS